MSKEDDSILVQGKVIACLANTRFKVKIESGQEIISHISGKLRKNFIRIITGDIVTLSISPYDLTKGRITYRGPLKAKKDEESTDLKS